MKTLKLFFWVILLQIFILNNLQFSGYINPYYYIIFILFLPNKINKSLSLILSLLVGLSIDMFSNTHGSHAFSCVLIGYLKIIWTRKTIQDSDETFDFFHRDIRRFIGFVLPFILIHHGTLFFLERFSFREIIPIIKLTISSSFFTLILFIIHKAFIPKK